MNEKTGQKEYQTTFIGAEDLVYDDQGRKATYTTDARMNAPEGDVRGKKLELFLSPAAGKSFPILSDRYMKPDCLLLVPVFWLHR